MGTVSDERLALAIVPVYQSSLFLRQRFSIGCGTLRILKSQMNADKSVPHSDENRYIG